MAEDEKSEDKTNALSKTAKATDAESGSVSVTHILAIVAVVIGLVAAGIAGYALYAVKHQAKTYTTAEQDSAKIALCDALKLASYGISINTKLSVTSGTPDQTTALAIAANARLAFVTGGQYVSTMMAPGWRRSAERAAAAADPGTPPRKKRRRPCSAEARASSQKRSLPATRSGSRFVPPSMRESHTTGIPSATLRSERS